jgi:plastocyanin
MSNKYIIVLVVVLLIIVGGFYFFSNQNPGSSLPANTQNQNLIDNNVTTTPKTPAPKPIPIINTVVHNVSISNFAFVPATITVRKGETIVWTNKDSTPHTVTGGDLLSNPLGQGETYSFAYDKTGTFAYHCSIHPSMKGTVIVTN